MTDFTKLDKSQWDRVTTRDGRKVRLLCVDGPGPWPVVGFISDQPLCHEWNAAGSIGERKDCPRDLILPPEPRVLWLRVYGEGRKVRLLCDDEQPRKFMAGDDYRDWPITITGDEAKIERVE